MSLATTGATIPDNGQPVTVFVAIPVDDGHRFCFWKSLMDLLMAPVKDGVRYRLMPVPGDSLVPRIRNNLVYAWMNVTQDDFLLFLDSDLDFRVEDVQSLVSRRLPIVAGLYGKKQDSIMDVLDGKPPGWVINGIKGAETFHVDGGIYKVATVGTGAMLIHRSVITAMVDAADSWPHWKIKYKDDNNPSEERWHLFSHVVIDDPEEFPHSPRDMSEDWAFCYFARKLGFDIWLDTSAVFLHEGSILYPLQARRLSKAEVDGGYINQPNGTQTVSGIPVDGAAELGEKV